MRLLLALMLCAPPLSSCQSVDNLSDAVPTAEASSDLVPATLTGEYRVAGIDGEQVRSGIALTIDDTVIGFDPRCAGFTWSYTYDAGVLTTDRPMGPVCRIAVQPEQRALAGALDAVTKAARTPSNGIELSSEGHSVLLFTQ